MIHDYNCTGEPIQARNCIRQRINSTGLSTLVKIIILTEDPENVPKALDIWMVEKENKGETWSDSLFHSVHHVWIHLAVLLQTRLMEWFPGNPIFLKKRQQ
jgi:hypothetical protein